MNALALLLVLVQSAAYAQSSLVINELQGANRRTVVDAQGRTPDWIEIYNPTDVAQNMQGMRFAVAGRQHMIEKSLVIAPHELHLLWFDGHPERGADHIGFSLPRKGGTLVLVSADGSTIMDLFTYPAMAGDLSVGRLNDGTRDWTFFTQATPGEPNHGTVQIHGRAPAPIIDSTLSSSSEHHTLGLLCEACDEMRFTLDGTEPTAVHGTSYAGPLTLASNAVLRARAFKADQLPSKELCMTVIDGRSPEQGITLALDQRGLSDDSIGINVEGALANFSRRGRPWERLAMVQFNASGSAPIPVGISIHGSGSRGLAKRSFKLHARDRYDSPVQGMPLSEEDNYDEGILRADAGPHNFLRNLFIEEVIQRYGLEVAVQPSTPVPLYLNGSYWGLYRWMPPKDAQWLERISGAEAVDVLEGPAAVVKSGSDAHFKMAQQRLLDLMPLDSIDAVIDTRSLIDLACLDLYTGRADHELNVRCYRPRQVNGRWRWVVYDMDLWAPANENSIQRMGLSNTPETPYIPQLLQHTELHERFLARFTALQATAFAPAEARTLVDRIYRDNEAALLLDHARWQVEMPRPDPATCMRELEAYITERPASLFKHMRAHSGHKVRTVVIDVPPPTTGSVLLEGLALSPGRNEVQCFQGIRMHLEAVPANGFSFTGWKGQDIGSPLWYTDLSKERSVRPLFVEELP